MPPYVVTGDTEQNTQHEAPTVAVSLDSDGRFGGSTDRLEHGVASRKEMEDR